MYGLITWGPMRREGDATQKESIKEKDPIDVEMQTVETASGCMNASGGTNRSRTPEASAMEWQLITMVTR